MKIKTANILLAAFIIGGCTTTSIFVRQQDLDAWINVPVEELDTHSVFLTIPMTKTITKDGIEIRNYANTGRGNFCSANLNQNSMGANTSASGTCVNRKVGCNNIFYIKDGVVLEYMAQGSCFTNKSLQPEYRLSKYRDK